MLINNAVAQLLFDDVAPSASDSDVFALPAVTCLISWQYWFTVDPSAFTVQMLTSNDGEHFNVVDLDTSTTGNINSFVTSAPFIMARVASVTGGSGFSLSVVSKPVSYPAQNTGSNVLRRRVILTNAQIKDLPNTPIEVVPTRDGYARIPLFMELQPVFASAYATIMTNPAAFAAGFGLFSTDGGDFLSGPFENPDTVNYPGPDDGLTLLLGSTWAAGDVSAHFRVVPFGGNLGVPLSADFASDILLTLELDTTHSLTGGNVANYLIVDVFYIETPVS